MALHKQQGEVSPTHPASTRLALALAISLAFHLSLILGLQVRPAQVGETRQNVIDVRLEQPAAAPIQQPETVVRKEAQPTKLATPAPQPAPQAPKTVAEVAPPTPTAPQPPSALPGVDIPLIEDPTYYPAKQLDVLPKPLQPVKPKYPAEADAANVGGQVKMLILIDEQGAVRDISVVEARPEGYGFEESAVEAFRNVRFNPAIRKGRAVKSRGIFVVTFDASAQKH